MGLSIFQQLGICALSISLMILTLTMIMDMIVAWSVMMVNKYTSSSIRLMMVLQAMITMSAGSLEGLMSIVLSRLFTER